ncbi:MAG: ABC transporter permease [Planctomycetaceae bacterium]|nr:ABC transporter permease [Planctomycetaceae bacterium]
MNLQRTAPLHSGAGVPVCGRGGRLFAASTLSVVALFVAGWLTLIFNDVVYTAREAIKETRVTETDASHPAAVPGLPPSQTLFQKLVSPEITSALWLSLWTSAVTVVIGLGFAIPMGYALSRYRFPGHTFIDSVVDLPILLPPLVIGLSLLVFFQTAPGRLIEDLGLKFVFQKKGIILCQFLDSASFGIRAVKLAFDGVDPRLEHVAMTLGCGRAGAFFHVALPLARRGIVVGGILIWTRAFGIFGPLMVFVGAVRMRTEVLPTTIYLEQSVGRIEVALAVALLMIALATVALVTIRLVGLERQ